jgi:hypothetical protein
VAFIGTVFCSAGDRDHATAQIVESRKILRGKERAMNARKERKEPHEFSDLPGFDQAMRKIAGTPKKEVDRRERNAKRRRKK